MKQRHLGNDTLPHEITKRFDGNTWYCRVCGVDIPASLAIQLDTDIDLWIAKLTLIEIERLAKLASLTVSEFSGS
jgi:hypothetical protein